MTTKFAFLSTCCCALSETTALLIICAYPLIWGSATSQRTSQRTRLRSPYPPRHMRGSFERLAQSFETCTS
ncbi:hypothetical protein BJ741DRAFT_608364 [Chytriomyces cf. hyalinus JEL632]|nr:hypothetical protein BJ741DRAFT_608364 [Chytriomyces cf. hyalinus JEL632]